MHMGCRSHLVPLALAVGLVAVLSACGGRTRPAAAEADAGQRQAIERARNLCQDLGYIPGTVDFARCAQSEYDRFAGAPPAAAAAVPRAPQAGTAPVAAAAPTRSDGDGEDWLVRWFKRPNVCQTATCSGR